LAAHQKSQQNQPEVVFVFPNTVVHHQKADLWQHISMCFLVPGKAKQKSCHCNVTVVWIYGKPRIQGKFKPIYKDSAKEKEVIG
jgi:hypothetical protein